MSISVTNFLLKYLRPVLISATDFTDAILGYWIDQALIDISRSFPRKTYALWDTVIHQQSYGYADSTTITDDATIIRVLNCLYPWVSDENPGISLVRKSYLDSDFYGGDYYEPDNDFQMLYVGPTVSASKKIYCDCHIIWQTSSSNIINPSEHYELIVLFCAWQAVTQQMHDAATATIVDTSLINSLPLQVRRAEIADRAAYTALDEAKATSGIAKGWSMDKWDTRAGGYLCHKTPGSQQEFSQAAIYPPPLPCMGRVCP